MNRRLFSPLVILVLLLSVCACLTLCAQTTTAGAISGTVTDSTGALLPNVRITVTNQGTHQAVTVVTSSRGSYSAENLPGGDYTVSTSMTGFQQSSVTGIHLDPGQRRGQDFKLTVGNVDTKVNVQADTLAVQT